MTDSEWYEVKNGVDPTDVLYEYADANPRTTGLDYNIVFSDDKKRYRFHLITTEEEVKAKILTRDAFITRRPELGAMLVLLCGEPDPPMMRGGYNRITNRSGTEIDAALGGGMFYFTANKQSDNETVWEVWAGKPDQRQNGIFRVTGHRPVATTH